MENNLTHKQKLALSAISDYIQKYGISPTLNELRKILKLKAISSVQRHLQALKKKGYLTTEKHKSRGIRPQIENGETVNIPLVGNVACDKPFLAEENIEAYVPVDRKKIKGETSNYFFLRAVGDSMDLAGIDNGDFVLVKKTNHAESGSRVVVLIGDEATIKKFKIEHGAIKLVPESSNPKNKPLYFFKDIIIQGTVYDVFKNKN